MINDLKMTPVDDLPAAGKGRPEVWPARFAAAAQTPSQWYRLETKTATTDLLKFAKRDGYKAEAATRGGKTYFRVLAD